MLAQVQAELKSRGLAVTAGTNSITVTSAVVTAEVEAFQLAVASAEDPQTAMEHIKAFVKRFGKAIAAGGFMFTAFTGMIVAFLKAMDGEIAERVARILRQGQTMHDSLDKFGPGFSMDSPRSHDAIDKSVREAIVDVQNHYGRRKDKAKLVALYGCAVVLGAVIALVIRYRQEARSKESAQKADSRIKALTAVNKELKSYVGAQTATGSAVVTAADEFAGLQAAFAAAETPEAKLSVLDKIKKFVKRHFLTICAGGYLYSVVYRMASGLVKANKEWLRRVYIAGLQAYDRGHLNKDDFEKFVGDVTQRSEDRRFKIKVATIVGIAGVTALIVAGIIRVNRHHDQLEAKKAERDAKKVAKRQAREAQMKALNAQAQQAVQQVKQLAAKGA